MAERRPNLKKPGLTATGRQWQTIDALCRDGWVVLDKGEANAVRVVLRGLIDCHDAMDHKATDICEFVAEARRVLARIEPRASDV